MPFYRFLNTTGGLSCISLTVWPQHSSQCAYLTFHQVHWQSEQDDNGRPWTLCTTGQDCDGLQLRHILILIRIKAVRLAQSHQLQTYTEMHKCADTDTHTLSNRHLHACRHTQMHKTSGSPIMDVTAQRVRMDRFPRSVWNICQQETYTECRLFTPFGENTHYVNYSSFGLECAQLETVC